MADTYLVLLKAIISTLRDDAAVGAVVGDRIYSSIPQSETFPYALVTIDSEPYAAKDFSDMAHDVQVQIFSRNKSPLQAANGRKAVFDALDRQEGSITLDTGRLVSVQFNGTAAVFKEPDGITWQSVINFRALI